MNVQELCHPVTPYYCHTPTFKGASGSQPPLLQPQQSPSLTTVQTFASQTIDPDSPEVEFTRRGNFPSQGCIQGVINRIQWGRDHPTFFFLYVNLFSSLVWFQITVEITALDALELKTMDFWGNSHMRSHVH